MATAQSSSMRETRYSVCPYNCWPVNCGLAVTSENGRIVEIGGNPHHDLNRGMLCVKGQSCGEIIDNRHRITAPMVREGKRGGNSWRPVTWEEALNTIAGRMKANIDDGLREANAIYHSHGNIVQRINWKVLTPRFANMIGMTLWDGNFPCWYDVGVAQELTGFYGLHDPVEMGSHSKAVINWAQDPCASMANMVPYIIQVKERGGQVVTIDPRITQTAAISDLHIRPRFGTDVWLANAVANILLRENAFDQDFIEQNSHGFEEYRRHIENYPPNLAAEVCEIPLEKIEDLAIIYADSKPLCTNLTRGALGKHSNGVQMVRAVLCLVALSGNIGKKGGGAVWGETLDWNTELQAKSLRPAAPYPENNFNAIDTALEDGIIDTLLVVGGNPLSQWPNINRLRKQLRQVGMIVVYDLFLNHTAREAADIFLPATAWLEELGLRTSNTRVYLMDKVVDPPGECREAGWWMDGIARRLGIDDYFPWSNKEECLDECLRSPTCYRASVAALRRRPDGIEGIIPEVPYADGKFSSPSGKFEFYSTVAEELGMPAMPHHEEPIEGINSRPELAKKYPLLLISARRNTHFHSFHDSHRVIPTLRAIEPEPVLWVHPKDASNRGIADGDLAEMFNDRGKARVRIELTTEVAAGHVSLNDCWPELNMVTAAHAPCPPEVTARLGVGGQPSYQNALVEIRRGYS